MPPKAKELKIDSRLWVSRFSIVRKSLKKRMAFPADAEHAMVRKAHGRADTPAAATRTRKSGAKTGARASHIRRSKNDGNKIVSLAFELAQRLQGQA
jgi:hypothetical protein